MELICQPDWHVVSFTGNELELHTVSSRTKTSPAKTYTAKSSNRNPPSKPLLHSSGMWHVTMRSMCCRQDSLKSLALHHSHSLSYSDTRNLQWDCSTHPGLLQLGHVWIKGRTAQLKPIANGLLLYGRIFALRGSNKNFQVLMTYASYLIKLKVERCHKCLINRPTMNKRWYFSLYCKKLQSQNISWSTSMKYIEEHPRAGNSPNVHQGAGYYS